jgi:opacity protein-like surface antigen
LAPEQHVYVGASAGGADLRSACDGVPVSCDAIAGFSASTAEGDRNTGLTFGLGAMYDFTRHIAARAEC